MAETDANHGLPPQRAELVLLHGERWRRAAAAMRLWSENAKKCVDFYEDKQWSDRDRAILESQGRPVLTINKIAPIVGLVMGYHLNNLLDIRYAPGHDGTGSADMARVLTHISKNIAQRNMTKFTDVEMLLDALVTGRGYQDWRMDFSQNDLGEVRVTTVDPFTVYPDPDATEYSPNDWNYVFRSKWLSLEEIEHWYGRKVADLVMPLTNGMTFQNTTAGLLGSYDDVEVTPWRRFGGEESDQLAWQEHAEFLFHDWVDKARKQVRMVEIQHYVLTQRQFFVDLETGDRKPVPDTFTPDRVGRIMLWAKEMNYPLTVETRPTRRLRLTHMIGDIIVLDRWSPYETMTIIGLFPWFRRGRTKGLVERLIGLQEEINRTRSARQNIVGRTAAGAWVIEKNTMDAEARAHHERNASAPGYTAFYDSKGRTLPPPTPINPPDNQLPWEKLEKDAERDLQLVSGLNAAALGQLESATASGVHILARQRQAVLGLELPMLNYHRTKRLCGEKQLELIQAWYTERRIIRVLGENGENPVSMVINDASAVGIINNVTVGRYEVVVDEVPVSRTFLEGTFRELLELKGMGMPIPDDHIIDASSYPRKTELKMALAKARQQQAALAATSAESPDAGRGPGPGGSLLGTDGGSLPKRGGEPGVVRR